MVWLDALPRIVEFAHIQGILWFVFQLCLTFPSSLCQWLRSCFRQTSGCLVSLHRLALRYGDTVFQDQRFGFFLCSIFFFGVSITDLTFILRSLAASSKTILAWPSWMVTNTNYKWQRHSCCKRTWEHTGTVSHFFLTFIPFFRLFVLKFHDNTFHNSLHLRGKFSLYK